MKFSVGDWIKSVNPAYGPNYWIIMEKQDDSYITLHIQTNIFIFKRYHYRLVESACALV